MEVPSYNYDLTNVAVQAAHKAGDLLRRGFGSHFDISKKSNTFDIVTEFDKAAELAVISHITKFFPSHAFLAEESGSIDKPNAPICWIIDPLDGTLNFAHHIPTFCISIAAVSGTEILSGVIYQPLLDELFVAEKGHGAFLNNVRLRVSTVEQLNMALISTRFPYDSPESRQKSIQSFSKILSIGNPIRITGSAALSLAYVASGRFDAYWGLDLSPWDFAAGKLLIEEAGGTITSYNGENIFPLKNCNTLATNTALHAAILSYMK